MRISIAVNAGAPIVASLPQPGFLSVHLNMNNRPKENVNLTTVQAVAHETRETETIRMKWPNVDLKVGDVVELRVLDEGEGSQPSEIKMSSEDPNNLFSNPELAKELIQVVSDFEARLRELFEKSKELEPLDEHKKIMRAWGSIIWNLGVDLLYPVYRRHKELIPEEMKGEML
jgi:hypothetical protein